MVRLDAAERLAPDENTGAGRLMRAVVRLLGRLSPAAVWTLAAAGVAATIAGSLAYVAVYGVDIPFWDEWINIDLLRRHTAGKLSLAQMAQLHNEHRLFFPRLVVLAQYALIGDYSAKLNMWVCQGLFLGVLALLLRAFLRTPLNPLPRAWRALLAAPLAALWLTLRQFANLIWGFQVTFMLVIIGAVLCLYAVSRFCQTSGRTSMAWLLTALLGATLASGSSAMGLLVWPVALAMLLACRRPRRWLPAAIWALLVVGVWWAYFQGYRKPPQHPELSLVWRQPLYFLYFLLALIGAPVVPFPAPAAAAGAFILLLALLAWWRLLRHDDDEAGGFWHGLALFGLLTAGSFAVGRGGFGIRQSLSSRYITFALLPAASAYVWLVAAGLRGWRTHRPRLSLAAALACGGLLAGTVGLGLICGVHGGRVMRQRNRVCVRLVRSAALRGDSDLSAVYPAPAFCRECIAFLEAHRMTPFR